MKLVFISSLVPVKSPSSGYDIANRVIVDGLIALGHDVRILGFLTPGCEPAYPKRTTCLAELEVTNSKVGKRQKAQWLATAILKKKPVSVAKMYAASAQDFGEALEIFRPFDGLILNSVQLPGAFQEQLVGDKSIFVAHNVEHKSAEKNALAASGALSKLLFFREAQLVKKIEENLCANATHIWTLADQDRYDLNIVEKSDILPLVTRFDHSPVLKFITPTHDIGLIGSWSWAANRQGLDWFLDHIVPNLPDDFSISIAGSIGQVPRIKHPNLKFVGRVEDAHDFVRSCRVIPLISREGTGVQLKTIETFELGATTVATENALRGIKNRPENCVVADSAEAFTKALIASVKDARTLDPAKATGATNRGINFHQNQKSEFLTALRNGVRQLQSQQCAGKVA